MLATKRLGVSPNVFMATITSQLLPPSPSKAVLQLKEHLPFVLVATHDADGASSLIVFFATRLGDPAKEQEYRRTSAAAGTLLKVLPDPVSCLGSCIYPFPCERMIRTSN